MTQEKFREILNFLNSNHKELYLKFSTNLSADENGFYISKPAKVSEEDYAMIQSVTNKWRDKNE